MVRTIIFFYYIHFKLITPPINMKIYIHHYIQISRRLKQVSGNNIDIYNKERLYFMYDYFISPASLKKIDGL